MPRWFVIISIPVWPIREQVPLFSAEIYVIAVFHNHAYMNTYGNPIDSLVSPLNKEMRSYFFIDFCSEFGFQIFFLSYTNNRYRQDFLYTLQSTEMNEHFPLLLNGI